jgi:manganese/zinc/iron transport system substrate-binding protein
LQKQDDDDMRLTRRAFGSGLSGLALATLASRHARADRPLEVVATTGMIADAARNVIGEAGRVTGLIGADVDPHGWRPTRTDMAALTRADLILWNGLYLEAQLQDVVPRLAQRTPVLAAAEAVPADLRLADPDYPERHDPHVWMEPALWQLVVGAVADAAAGAYPEHADRFAQAAAAHRADIAAVGAWAAERLATVPVEARLLITAHDAFGYFGRAFGFQVEGVQGISTESEAGLRRIEELVALIVERRVRAVFVETSVSERNLRALVEGAAARGWTVEIGGALYADAMGPEGTHEGTWLGMIDHNVTTITRALGGEAPAGGWRGLLRAPA